MDGNLAFMQKNKQVCNNKGKQTETVNTQIKGYNVYPSLTKKLKQNSQQVLTSLGSLQLKVKYYTVLF